MNYIEFNLCTYTLMQILDQLCLLIFFSYLILFTINNTIMNPFSTYDRLYKYLNHWIDDSKHNKPLVYNVIISTHQLNIRLIQDI